MQQMCRYGLTAIFLLSCTWQDIKTGKISCGLFCLFTVTGILSNILLKNSLLTLPVHILPGIGILLFCRLSGEQIGYGDGLTMTVAGLFLTGREIIGLFLIALTLCSVSAMVLFLFKKVGKKTTIPFLPFLTAGFVIYMLLSRL